MTEHRRPLGGRKGWARGAVEQAREGRLDLSTDKNENDIWDSQYAFMKRIYRDDLKWRAWLLKDDPQSRWTILGGIAMEGRFCTLSFRIVSIIVYNKDNKKVLAVQSCSQAAERSECDRACHKIFLLLYFFFTFSLASYLSSTLISLLSPASRRAKSNSPSLACPSFTGERPGSRRTWSTSSRPSGCPAPAWGRRGHLSPFESGRRYWLLRAWRPDPQRRRRSLASHCASGSPATWKQ